jgi:hypothetical protein
MRVGKDYWEGDGTEQREIRWRLGAGVGSLRVPAPVDQKLALAERGSLLTFRRTTDYSADYGHSLITSAHGPSWVRWPRDHASGRAARKITWYGRGVKPFSPPPPPMI